MKGHTHLASKLLRQVEVDLRFGARIHARRPVFLLATVLLLAVGISVALLGHTLARAPFRHGLPEPDVVANLGLGRLGAGPIPAGLLREVAAESRTLARVAAAQPVLVTAGTPASETETAVARVTAEFFRVLGVAPHIGRAFSEEEHALPGRNVLILGHALWKRRFGGDPSVLGRDVVLGGESYLVIGVMPAGFRFPATEAWTPASFDRLIAEGRQAPDGVIGVARLKDGSTWQAAKAEMRLIDSRLARVRPELFENEGLRIQTLDDFRGLRQSQMFLIFQAPSFLLLLITVLSVGGLLFSRTIDRERELATRVALGASRGSLVCQFAVEGMLVAVPAAALAVAFLALETRALQQAAPAKLHWLVVSIGTERPTLTAVGLALLLAVGGTCLAPLPLALRRNVVSGLRSSLGTPLAGLKRVTLRDVIVVVQVCAAGMAMCLVGWVVAVASSMLAPVFGFEEKNTAVLHLHAPACSDDDCRQQLLTLGETLAARYRRLSGVADVSISASLPQPLPSAFVRLRSPSSTEQQLVSRSSHIGPRFFSTLGVGLLRGREFTPADLSANSLVVIVSASLAEALWPGDDPLEQFLSLDSNGPSSTPYRVLGVAPDLNHVTFDGRSRRMVYRPISDLPGATSEGWLLLRTTLPIDRILPRLRRSRNEEASSAGIGIPMEYRVALVEAMKGTDMEPEVLEFMTTVVAYPSLFALWVAVAGVVSVTVESVIANRHALAVRSALGASPRALVAAVVVPALTKVGLGLIPPLAALGALLYGAGANGPPLRTGMLTPEFLGTMAVALCALALGCYIPGRRAAYIDPGALHRE